MNESFPTNPSAAPASFGLNDIPGAQLRMPFRRRTKSPLRYKILIGLIPLWLIASQYFGGIEAGLTSTLRTSLQVINLGVMFLYGFWVGGKRFLASDALTHSSASLFFLVAFSGTLSGAFSLEPVRSLLSWASLLAAMVLCAGLWPLVSGRVPAIMTVYSIVASVSTFVIYLIFNTGGRYQFFVNPNTWGIYCYGAAVTALFIKNRFASFLVVGMSFFVALKAEARGSIVGLGIAFVLYAAFQVSKGFKTRPLYVGLLLVAISTALVAAAVYPEIISEQIENILLLTSRGRGVGSGFTGRTEAWGEALTTFQHYPLLGVGPRLQDLYINFGGLKNAHNGYLVALIELGLFGFLTLMTFLAIRVYKILVAARKGNHLAEVGFCLWAGYAFIGLFDSRLINAGNPTSLHVWFFLLMPDRSLPPPARQTGFPSGFPPERYPLDQSAALRFDPKIANDQAG